MREQSETINTIRSDPEIKTAPLKSIFRSRQAPIIISKGGKAIARRAMNGSFNIL
jgi:hypothetical protein